MCPINPAAKRASSGRWRIFHLPGQNGPVSGTRRRDESDTCGGDSFSHLGIMVLIGVPVVVAATLGEKKRKEEGRNKGFKKKKEKVCDNTHN